MQDLYNDELYYGLEMEDQTVGMHVHFLTKPNNIYTDVENGQEKNAQRTNNTLILVLTVLGIQLYNR